MKPSKHNNTSKKRNSRRHLSREEREIRANKEIMNAREQLGVVPEDLVLYIKEKWHVNY